MKQIGKTAGIVYLVGAGPGDPDLVTVKATRLMTECDVVVYDNLVPDELVTGLPDRVERRYVGKKSGRHTLSQDKINELLLSLAAEGRTVVRLKGGDPFVFGRGGEEAQFLREHGIKFEVVPGVTSGMAAPAFAGIPCTDRHRASVVTFVTGHRAVGESFSNVPWEWISQARTGTLVIYMGVAEIDNIVKKLLDGGMSPDTATAAIERGTFPSQTVLTSPLSDLPKKVKDHNLQPPVIFVIGETARLHDTLRWFEGRSLLGLRVLVTRPADQALPMYRALRDLGAEVQPYPTIATKEKMDETAWNRLRGCTSDRRWLLFTSENCVRYFLKQWHSIMGDIRGMADYRIAAIGDSTVRVLRENSLEADFVPTEATTAVLIRQMIEKLDLTGASVVRIRGSLADDRIKQALTEAGADVIPIEVYGTHSVAWPDEVKEKLSAYPPDVIVFTSGSTARALAENLTDEELEQLTTGAAIFSIGPSTSKAIRSCGMAVGFESKGHTIPTMIEELVARHQTASLIKRSMKG